ncbi:SAM-dependent methyltransferase [Patulibacter sp. SYSU D01012]|uniref:SAM-dependent methyltransferase n=1 Tax=Patulibacter sp. SYSU D01012 TaxID=2817381 RepID=UPI001B30FA7C
MTGRSAGAPVPAPAAAERGGRRPFGPADFEALWRRDADPWGFASSAYEAEKYERTLRACGAGPFGRALELASANGVFTTRLAPRCRRLETLEAAPTAVALARARLAAAGHADVAVRAGLVPDDLPDAPGAFDLVVASEVLYYLDRPVLDRTVDALAGLLAPGGRLVAVHWTPDAPDHALPGHVPHDVLRGRPDLRRVVADEQPTYLLDAFVRA